MQEKRSLWRRILGILLIPVLLAVFYIAVVMGQPQGEPDKSAPAAKQPLPHPLENAMHISSEEQLTQLSADFPAPLMYPAYAEDLVFAGGVLKDTAYEGGVARIATLTYHTADGAELSVVSIYPARALDLMGRGDYRNASAGPSLAGIPSARMENGDTIRLHAQGNEALYVLTLPRSLSGTMQRIATTMQLFTKEP
jgi:hypothetical protein